MTFLRRAAFLTLMIGAGAAGASANDPAAVVRAQLAALTGNDDPYPDAGIERTWAYAHPDNRAATGPLARFKRLLKSGAYRDLLGHRSHTVERVDGDGNAATFLVTVQTDDHRIVRFAWTVEQVRGGDEDGRWMTTRVSPARPLGESI